jgi:hypothetical protein
MAGGKSGLEYSWILAIFDHGPALAATGWNGHMNRTGLICYQDFLLMLLAVLVTRVISVYCFYLYDDAFITFRYTKNLVNGLGFVYNAGERVQGTTSPLWALILAIPVALGLAIEGASRGLGIAADVLTAGVLYWGLRRESLAKAAMLAGFLFALDLYLAKNAVGGMEGSLFLLVTVASTFLMLGGRTTVAAVLAGASVFLRPEGLLFALCLTGYLWYDERRFPAKAVGVGLLVIAGGVIVQWAYFGDLIPQSVRGKLYLPRSYDALWKLVLFPARDPLQGLLTLTSLFFARTALRASRFVKIYGLWCAVLFASWLISGAHLWMWYCEPVFFIKTVITGVGVACYAPRWVERLRPAMLLGGVLAAWIALGVYAGPDRIERTIHRPMRQWAAGRDLSQQTAYGMDFGAFGYYTNVRMLDEPGLVYPAAISRYHTDPEALLLGEKPDWALVTCYGANMRMMQQGVLRELYEPVKRFAETGATELVPDADRVSAEWSHDFLLYRRRTAVRPHTD